MRGQPCRDPRSMHRDLIGFQSSERFNSKYRLENFEPAAHYNNIRLETKPWMNSTKWGQKGVNLSRCKSNRLAFLSVRDLISMFLQMRNLDDQNLHKNNLRVLQNFLHIIVLKFGGFSSRLNMQFRFLAIPLHVSAITHAIMLKA